MELRLEIEVGEREEKVWSGGEEGEVWTEVALVEVGELEEVVGRLEGVVGRLEPHILLAGLKAKS